MIRIVSANINGLKSAMNAGFLSLPHVTATDVRHVSGRSARET